jgi:hypothetical protein
MRREAKKGKRTMHSPTQNITHPNAPSRNGSERGRRSEDVIYQIVTVAAILLVLGTLWGF